MNGLVSGSCPYAVQPAEDLSRVLSARPFWIALGGAAASGKRRPLIDGTLVTLGAATIRRLRSMIEFSFRSAT
jgi:hypothetical protein